MAKRTRQMYKCVECGALLTEEQSSKKVLACECCKTNVDFRFNQILSYHSKPTVYMPMFRKWDNEYQIFGAELEIECEDNNKNEIRDIIYKHLGTHAYMNSDGSLSYGIEIIFYPHSINEWKKLKYDIESLFEELKTRGCTSYDNNSCGMHVHICRDYFGRREALENESVYNIMRFFNANRENIYKISGRRDYDDFDQWAGYNNGIREVMHEPYKDTAKSKLKHLKGDHSMRYSCINNENSATVECRIFNGTLNIDRFYANLAFVWAFAEVYRAKNVDESVDTNIYRVIDVMRRDNPKACDFFYSKGVSVFNPNNHYNV